MIAQIDRAAFTTVPEIFVLELQPSIHPAQRTAKNDADLFAVPVLADTGVPDGFARGNEFELMAPVKPPGLARFEMRRGIETGGLAGEGGGVAIRVPG